MSAIVCWCALHFPGGSSMRDRQTRYWDFHCRWRFPIVPLPMIPPHNVLDKLVQSMPAQVHALTFETNAKLKKNLEKRSQIFGPQCILRRPAIKSVNVYPTHVQPFLPGYVVKSSAKSILAAGKFCVFSVWECVEMMSLMFKAQTWKPQKFSHDEKMLNRVTTFVLLPSKM